jgi:hypothetical protein
MQQVIHIRPEAPAKPARGQTCNGCGVCCLAEPCPLGQLLSRRRQGACDALRWDETTLRYQCGAVTDPKGVWPLLPSAAVSASRRLALRWISAAEGCDSDVDVVA